MLKGLTSNVVRTKPQGPAVTSCSPSFTARQTPPTQFQASLWAGCEEQSGYRISGFSVATASLMPVKAAFYSGAGWERGWDTPQKRATGQLRDQCRKRNSQGSFCPRGWKWALAVHPRGGWDTGCNCLSAFLSSPEPGCCSLWCLQWLSCPSEPVAQ